MKDEHKITNEFEEASVYSEAFSQNSYEVYQKQDVSLGRSTAIKSMDRNNLIRSTNESENPKNYNLRSKPKKKNENNINQQALLRQASNSNYGNKPVIVSNDGPYDHENVRGGCCVNQNGCFIF